MPTLSHPHPPLTQKLCWYHAFGYSLEVTFMLFCGTLSFTVALFKRYLKFNNLIGVVNQAQN